MSNALVPRNNNNNILARIAEATTVAAFQAIAYDLGSEAAQWLQQQIRQGAATSEEYIREGLTNWYTNFMSEDYGRDNPALRQPQRLLEYETPMDLARRTQSQQISPAGETRITGTRRQLDFGESSQSNIQRTETMSSTSDANMESSSRSMSTARSGPASQSTINGEETAITYATPSYQLQDTHTTILPVTFNCSMVLNRYTATDFILRLNCIELPLQTLLTAKPANILLAGTSQGAPLTTGLYNAMIPMENSTSTNLNGFNVGTQQLQVNGYTSGNTPSATRWTLTTYKFPAELAAASQPGVFQKAWYNKMYDFMHVMGCDYEIIIQPTRHSTNLYNNDIVVASRIDTHSSTNTGDVLPSGLNKNVLQYIKNIKYEQIKAPMQDSPGYHVISGQYKTGTSKAMITNDGDVKRWIPTGTPNTYFEDLHMMFFAHDFNNISNIPVTASVPNAGNTAWENGTLTARTCVNMKVTLKYMVQFKDLKNIWRNRPIGTLGPWPAANDLAYVDYDTANISSNA